MKISVVIPCYGSQNTLGRVIEDTIDVITSRQNYTYELVLVCDASPDGVYDVITKYAEQDSNIKGIRFTKNFGQHAALLAGYRICTGDIVVSIDDDGQTPIDEVYSLIDKIEEGYDVVIGSHESSRHGLLRILGSKINKSMAHTFINMPKDLEATSYYVMKKYIVDEIIRYNNPYPYILGLVLRTTNNITNVKTKHHSRLSGSSGYTFSKLLSLWLNGFTAFSVKPLRFATISGVTFSILGFLLAFVIIINKLVNANVEIGWSSLMAGLLIIGGMIMMMIGLIGEYIGRIYVSLSSAPQYVINETLNTDQAK